jgi:hypothetical protein
VLRRLCITVRRRAIALTYYFEAAGSRQPGGGHGVGFFMCAVCVVCCVVHEVFFMCAHYVLFGVLYDTK